MGTRRLSRLVSMGAAAALVGGCAIGPDWHAPAAPPHAGFAPEPTPETTVGGAPAVPRQQLIAGRDLPYEWWQLFQSPALDALIERALRANPTVAAARAALAQARELSAAQKGYFYPSLGATYQAERHKISGNTNSSQTVGVQGNGVNLLPKAESLTTTPHNYPSYYSFYTAELSVGFVPDVFGGGRRLLESLGAQADAQRYALEATYVTLASNVAAAAIQAASLRAQIRATLAIIEADERALHILEDQLRSGFAMPIDVAQQESALAQARSTLPPLEKQLEVARDQLRALVGDLPNREDEGVELDALRLPDVPLSVPGRLIEQRPDIKAAEAQLHSANANIGIQTAAMLPQFSITGALGGNATEASRMFSRGGSFWDAYGDVNQPVFQGATLLHQERAAQAGRRQAAAQYRNTVLTAYQNVADSLHVVLSDARTLDAEAEAEAAARVTLDLTRRQMEAGYVPALVLLSAQTAYDQTLLARLQAQAARYADTVALFQALGGGWWNRQEVAAR